MVDYDIPQGNITGKDLVSAWLLTAAIVFAIFLVSIIHESVTARPVDLVERSVIAPVEDIEAGHAAEIMRRRGREFIVGRATGGPPDPQSRAHDM